MTMIVEISQTAGSEFLRNPHREECLLKYPNGITLVFMSQEQSNADLPCTSIGDKVATCCTVTN